MDAYDHMVAYLTERPQEIYSAWVWPSRHTCGALFAYAAPDSNSRTPSGSYCGCLTMVRNNELCCAWTEDLTSAIRADGRIPKAGHGIKSHHLPIFSGWQRRIDKILNRTPPVWNGPPMAKPEVDLAPCADAPVELPEQVAP